MSAATFQLVCALLAAGLVLAWPRVPGALIGFVCGIAIAFFAAPASFGLAALARRLGLPIRPKAVAIGLGAVWLGIAALRGYLAAAQWTGGNPDAARLLAAQALTMAALPLIGLISARTMAKAWP